MKAIFEEGIGQEQQDVVFWNLCNYYEKLTGSRAALNIFLTTVFRKRASFDYAIDELRSSISALKLKN